MVERTIPCKYCGKPVTGCLIESDALKVSQWTYRISRTIRSALMGNPFGVYRHASGKSTDNMISSTTKIMGGGMFHFNCPHCSQSFDKRVY